MLSRLSYSPTVTGFAQNAPMVPALGPALGDTLALATMSLKGLRPPQSTGLLIGACSETSRRRDSYATIRCTPVGGQVRTVASKSVLTAQHWNQDWNNDEDNPGSLLRPKPLVLARPPPIPSHGSTRPSLALRSEHMCFFLLRPET